MKGEACFSPLSLEAPFEERRAWASLQRLLCSRLCALLSPFSSGAVGRSCPPSSSCQRVGGREGLDWEQAPDVPLTLELGGLRQATSPLLTSVSSSGKGGTNAPRGASPFSECASLQRWCQPWFPEWHFYFIKKITLAH